MVPTDAITATLIVLMAVAALVGSARSAGGCSAAVAHERIEHQAQLVKHRLRHCLRVF